MKKALIVSVILLADIIAETVLLPFIHVTGVKPDLMLALIAAFAFMDDDLIAICIAVIGGLLKDLLFGIVLGPTAIVYICLAYSFKLICEKVSVGRVLMPAIIVFDATVMYNIFIGVIFALLRLEVSLKGLLTVIVFNGLYTAIVSVALYNLFIVLYKKWEFMSKRPSMFSEEKVKN